MNRLHLWIALLAVTAFLAGSASGFLLSRTLRYESPLSGPFAEYEKEFVEAFQPTPQQVRVLRKILLAYQHEVEEIKNVHVDVVGMEKNLSELGLKIEGLIKLLLREDQIKAYEQLSDSRNVFLPMKGKPN